MNATTPPDETTIAERVSRIAARCGLSLDATALTRIVGHARAVLGADPELHLTSIDEVARFIDRHVGESLEGAAMLDAAPRGAMLDLGSGNGYPGLPIAAVHAGLTPYLAEASHKKAAFLGRVLAESWTDGVVLEHQIQRAADLAGAPPFAVVVTRAMGNWERVVPRLAAATATGARVLVWAGPSMEQVVRRAAWRRLELIERRALHERERSWIWAFRTRS